MRSKGIFQQQWQWIFPQGKKTGAPGRPRPDGFAVLRSEARRRTDPDNTAPFPEVKKNLDTMGSRGCNEGLRRKNCKIVKKAVPDLCPVRKTPAMTAWPGQNQWL